ncbi:unnamed protein product [Clonostachys solani]|uniref:F-box domain-containing protein n=1 Tax=Clonostachys solani TaxID=160281 RepID=A0A9P0EQE5_9HYPO|nr:unnamed protein product [Clonostachys solani]
MTSIHSVLTFRESWPLSRELDLKGVYEELRRLQLFVAVIRACSLRRAEQKRMGPGLDGKKSEYPPVFSSVEIEDALVLGYLDQALFKYTRSPEEDPNADGKKWLLSFGTMGGETRVKPLTEHDATGAGFTRRYLAVRRWAEMHEKFLRNRANELSRNDVRALNLLDLPVELLANVFDFFKHPALSIQGGVDWKMEGNGESNTRSRRFETLKNARLVCRHFNTLVSPLLCPILRLNVEGASLDRLRKITASPSLRSGIRGIKLNLNYCFEEIAMDEMLFLRVIRTEVNDFFSYCEHEYEDVDDRAEPTRKGNMLISSAISFCQDEGLMGANAGPEREDYQYIDALRRGYLNYKDLHLEQTRLLKHGDFAHALSKSLAQLKCSIGLKLCDDLTRYTYEDVHGILHAPGTRRTPQIFASAEALVKSISRPHQWVGLRGLQLPVGIEPARLLCELPLALHREGVSVDRFTPSILKRLRSFQQLCPRKYISDKGPEEGWGQLLAFSKRLRSFEIPPGEVHTEFSRPVQEPDMLIIENYFRAMLASDRLVNLKLSLGFLMHYTRPGPQSNGSRGGRYYELKSSIFTSPWPNLQRVSLRFLSLPQRELELFCQNLSYELVEFFMSDVKLSSGKWETIADMLHGRLAQTARLKKCTVKVSALRGGEAAEIAQRQNAKRNPESLSQHLIQDGSLELSRMVEQYLTGKCDINPLSFTSMNNLAASQHTK